MCAHTICVARKKVACQSGKSSMHECHSENRRKIRLLFSVFLIDHWTEGNSFSWATNVNSSNIVRQTFLIENGNGENTVEKITFVKNERGGAVIWSIRNSQATSYRMFFHTFAYYNSFASKCQMWQTFERIKYLQSYSLFDIWLHFFRGNQTNGATKSTNNFETTFMRCVGAQKIDYLERNRFYPQLGPQIYEQSKKFDDSSCSLHRQSNNTWMLMMGCERHSDTQVLNILWLTE